MDEDYFVSVPAKAVPAPESGHAADEPTPLLLRSVFELPGWLGTLATVLAVVIRLLYVLLPLAAVIFVAKFLQAIDM